MPAERRVGAAYSMYKMRSRTKPDEEENGGLFYDAPDEEAAPRACGLVQAGKCERLRERVGAPVPIVRRPELVHDEEALVGRGGGER